MYKLNTEQGAIRISKSVIGVVIRDALADFHKTVYIVNRKGAGIGLFGESYKPNTGNLVEINTEGNEVEIQVFIIIKFGESIKMTTDKMITAIRGALADRLQIEPQNLTIHIMGVKSKDIAKRNIVIKG